MRIKEEYNSIIMTNEEKFDKPCRTKLEKRAVSYALEQVHSTTDTRLGEQACLSLKIFNGYDVACAYKDGAKNDREQMMKNASEVEVKTTPQGIPYIAYFVELYDENENIPLAKNGDKYKVIIIKED